MIIVYMHYTCNHPAKCKMLCYLPCVAPTSPTASSPTGTGTYINPSKTMPERFAKHSISVQNKMRAEQATTKNPRQLPPLFDIGIPKLPNS